MELAVQLLRYRAKEADERKHVPIHGILWSRELKFSQCHNRTVATSLSMFVSERERTMTHTHRVRVIKYN